jgi:hypothetical protein
MRRLGKNSRSWSVAGVVIALGANGGLVAATTRSGAAANVRFADAQASEAVSRAVAGAAIRLADPRCQRVLAKFHDGSGRTLQERLDDSGADAAAYVSWVLFYPGDHLPACRSGRATVFAATMPGSRVVFVCSGAFRQRQLQAPAYAELIVIHEALHSLGLGEDPPRSEEISFRVQASCAH